MSPVIATTIILAITVVLGLSLWSFANAGVSTATHSYAESVNEYGKFTADRFVIASVSFNYPNTDDVGLWIYNSGKLNTTVSSIQITCRDCEPPFEPVSLNFAPVTLTAGCLESGSMTVLPKTLQLMELNPENPQCDIPTNPISVTFTPGKTYQVQVISETGAHQTIIQKDE